MSVTLTTHLQPVSPRQSLREVEIPLPKSVVLKKPVSSDCSARSTTTTTKEKSSTLASTVSGVLAGGLSKTLLQPLDLVRTKLQVSDSLAAGKSEIRKLFAHKSVSKLYRGYGVSLFGSSLNWGVYFGCYEWSKSRLHNDARIPHTVAHFAAGYGSSVAAILVTNPIWMVKTRLQIDPKVTGMLSCARSALRDEGVTTFYRGLVPACALCTTRGIQFVVYESMKSTLEWYTEEKTRWKQHLAMGALSKGVASAVTYPMSVVRARLFQKDKYTGLWNCLTTIFKHERVGGFYRGLSVNLLKTMPSSALTLMFYEFFVARKEMTVATEASSHYFRGMIGARVNRL